MANKQTRRDFVKCAISAAAGASLAMSMEEQALLTQAGAAEGTTAQAGREKLEPNSKATLPTGTLGKLKISRLVLGGNLIGGWAHSRDLLYVSDLLKHYFTEEKIIETLQIAEAHGVNCINTHPDSGPLLQKYRKEFGGKIQWIAQGFPDVSNGFATIKCSIDQGADAVYVQGNDGDRLVEEGKLDVLDKTLRFIESQGIPAGIGGHSLDVPKACEKAKLKPDFYVKTLHRTDYFSARRPDQGESVIHNTADNFWCSDPVATIEFMKTVECPWIAFKVMAAGAISPFKAFKHAFEGGADFILAGMFDFQIALDVRLANAALAKLNRQRPWRA
jgi:hypothetical protein